jgi:NADH-quinone oxidoreductase subunit H
MMLPLALQVYQLNDAENIWQVLRAAIYSIDVAGYRLTAPWANGLMLVAALLFIFMLELLLTLGIQVWERRTLARMQGRWGPQTQGNITPRTFRLILIPILLLLGLPAVLYGLEYWAQVDFDAITRIPASVEWLAAICAALAFTIYIVYTLGWAWRQGLIDAVKLFFKEDVVPLNADRFLFVLAPVLVYLPALLSWIVLPFGVAVVGAQYTYLVVQNLNVGILLIIADFAMFLVAVIMSGYASNNKYALIGAMREAAMLLTYEVPMLMALLSVALFAGSLNLVTIVEAQSTTWAILPLLPAFIIYLIVALAETNRPPFDLAEASNELMGGYLVEYSGIRFALFYVAEYANVFTVSALLACCFLGGWKGPMFLGADGLWLSSIFWMLLKTYSVMFFFIWARATMPRIRIDQIMFFSWKFLLPASVLVLCVTAFGVGYRHPWFIANQIPFLVPDPLTSFPVTEYRAMTTWQALSALSLSERVFFWCYNGLLLLISVFLLALAWRVLFGKRVHPRPRRAITWIPGGELQHRVASLETQPRVGNGGGGQ